MIQEKIRNLIKEALKNLGIEEANFVVEHPADLSMGDYSTNVAMALSKSLKSNPKEVAEKIVETLRQAQGEFQITEIQVAGPGFINFFLSKEFFVEQTKNIIQNENFGSNDLYKGLKIMMEYTDPNPFKPFHIGHLMSNSIGESISRLVEYSGAETIRANYQGDVGLHVAKAIYGILQKGKPKEDLSVSEKAEYIGFAYSFASNLYEEDENIKKEIDILNKKIYESSDATINEIYVWGRKITLEAFEIIYKKLGTKFKHYFFESEMAKVGKDIVLENLGKVFEESDGAIVFKGEKYDTKLHTRVFINSQNLPTYETKEIGLTISKFEKEKNLDKSIVITATEQADYMRVVQKALSLIYPQFESKMKHITHGMLRFATGKMSSRKGNIITGESLIKEMEFLVSEKIKDRELTEEEKNKIATQVGIGALKYSILKQTAGADIVYDFEKSISFEGDSGPYLQYSFARANSVLNKVKNENIFFEDFGDLNTWESVNLEKMLYRFEEVVLKSLLDYAPHHIANYLIEIAREFNSFYANNQIVNKEDNSSNYKIALTLAFSRVMKNGLKLLGIESPEKM